MVYCGKPSKGCLTCRAKRTKCDTKVPSCGQCLRKGLKCPGYRDELSLIFRNQTGETIRNHKSGVPASRDLSLKASDNVSGGSQEVEAATCLPRGSVVFALNPSINDQATCFFFKQYVLEDHVFNKGSWDFLPGMLVSESDDSPLNDATIALGSLALARSNHRGIPSVATERYARALRYTNKALQDPILVKSDRTLAIVELLSIFELANASGEGAVRSWVKHIDGAAALLRLRGQEQMKRSVGRKLYVQLRTQVMLSCTVRCIRAPEYIESWVGMAVDDASPEEYHAMAVVPLCVRVCNIQADLYSRPGQDAANAILALEALDTAFEDWALSCPPGNDFIEMKVDSPREDVFGDFYHIYQARWPAILWNHYRSTRILIQSLLITQYKRINMLPTELPQPFGTHVSIGVLELAVSPRIQEAKQKINLLGRSICASIPYCLELHTDIAMGKPPDTHYSEPIRMATATQALWPLRTAAVACADVPEISIWTAKMLERIKRDTGIGLGGKPLWKGTR